MNRRMVDPNSGPHAKLGVRLRRLRDQQGWSCDRMSEATGYTASHISNVEIAQRPATLKFARAVDVAFSLGGTRESFEAEVRRIKGGALLEGFAEYVDLETQCVELRVYGVSAIPGLVQTPGYAAELVQAEVGMDVATPDEAAERLQVIADRQRIHSRRPLIHLVLDESCLRRTVGPPEVWAAQLDALIEFADAANTILQVAPFGMGAWRPLHLPLYILTMPNRSVVSYAESAQRGHLERDTRTTGRMLAAYYQLQARAMSQAASVALIHELRKGTS
ncbi:helix-turn-helix domain-containing protein (plasmid) [Streptomyces sp. BI20]|uniref:helix-turn-helix domain-containing protein n=1 Tax=Streptomyces sp. BI20 TaxID=3403460 RepID=UPI003C757BDB